MIATKSTGNVQEIDQDKNDLRQQDLASSQTITQDENFEQCTEQNEEQAQYQLQQLTVQDLEILSSFYHQKLQQSVSSPAYFCVNQVCVQLQQDIIEFKKKHQTHLLAPLAGRIISDVRINSYCIACLKFINAARKEPRLPCPACQAVCFCSGFCSLEEGSHPCAILRRIGRQALLLQPEIARLHLQACGTLKRLVEKKDKILAEASREVQVDSFPPRQLCGSGQPSSALVRESDQFFRLSVQPIYNAIMLNKQRLGLEGPDMSLEPQIDPFLLPYFLRACQVLSSALSAIRAETKNLDRRCLDLNRRLSGLQDALARWDARLGELRQRNDLLPKISRPDVLHDFFNRLRSHTKELLDEYDDELGDINHSPRKALKLIYRNLKNKLLNLSDEQQKEEQKIQAQYSTKLQAKVKAQRDLNHYNAQAAQAQKRTGDAQEYQQTIKKALNALKEQNKAIFSAQKRPLAEVLLADAENFKDMADLDAFLAKFRAAQERPQSTAGEESGQREAGERPGSRVRASTRSPEPRQPEVPAGSPIGSWAVASSAPSLAASPAPASPEPLQHAHIRRHKFATDQIINQKYKQIREKHDQLQTEQLKKKHVQFAGNATGVAFGDADELSRIASRTFDDYADRSSDYLGSGSRPGSALSPSSRGASRLSQGRRASFEQNNQSKNKQKTVNKIELQFNLGKKAQTGPKNVKQTPQNLSAKEPEDKVSMISDIENDVRDIGRPSVILPQVPEPGPAPKVCKTALDEENDENEYYIDEKAPTSPPPRNFASERPKSATVRPGAGPAFNQSERLMKFYAQKQQKAYITKREAFAPDSKVSLKLEAQKVRSESAFRAGEPKRFTRAVIFAKKKPVLAREAQLLRDEAARREALEKNQTAASLRDTNNAAVFGLPVPGATQIRDRRAPELFAACHDARRRLTTARQLSSRLLSVAGNADGQLIHKNYQNVKQVQQTGKYDTFVMDTQKTARAYKALVRDLAAETRSYYINKMLLYTMAVNVFQQLEQDDQHYLRLSSLKKQFQMNLQRNSFAHQAKVRVLHKNFAASCKKTSGADGNQLGRNQRHRALMLRDTIAAAWRLPDVIRHNYYMQILQYIETGLGGEGLIG